MITFRKKQNFSSMLLIGMLSFFCLSALAQGFSDIPATHPDYVALEYLRDQEVIKGYEDGSFSPDRPISRAEALKVILVLADFEAERQAFEAIFKDVPEGEWFAPFVVGAYKKGIVSGDGEGLFVPARQVNGAEFLKMLLEAHGAEVSSFGNQALSDQYAADAWFAPYVNYAIQANIVDDGFDPAQPLSRGGAARVMYLFSLILKGKDTEFLLSQAQRHLAQIEPMIGVSRVDLALEAASLGVSLTAQALANQPADPLVQGAAKIAEAYERLVESFYFGIQKKTDESAAKANEAIDKAGEAWNTSESARPIAEHIAARAREILAQLQMPEI